MKTTTLDGKTPDIAEENIQKLKQLFPEVFTDNKVDFEKLQQVLGKYVEDSNERYNFTWNGKGRALRISQTPSLGTLRPCKEESKDWDTTQNLYIEGDNLEVLKLIQKSYYSKVKMIYIDPPYNTGKDFVYKDDFHDSLENYKRITGQVDGNGKLISTNTEASGRYHTNWLNMMYPRLRLARNLLTDDGVIFISIDDNEVHNLRKICDEIFGEDNFIDYFLWTKTSTPPSLSNKSRKTVEFVLCYEKKKNNYRYYGSELENGDAPLLNTGNPRKSLTFPIGTINLTFVDSGVFEAGKYGKVELMNDLVVKDGKNSNEVILNAEFKWGQDTLNEEISRGTFFLIKSDMFSIRFQRIDNEGKYKTPNNFLDIELNKERGVGTNESAVKELEILGLHGMFDYPKPISLIESIIKMITKEDKEAIILDFFSGSATTAHAVMQLNAEDSGNRKFIMVQLPEPTDENSEAYKAGYMNISEIGKERIRRAGEKIKKEKGLETQDLDIGFKVLKLDTSNIRKWQPDYDNIEQSLLEYVDNFVEGRTELDVVYEIMLKYGLDLTYPVDEFTIEQKKVYSIGFGMLMICLDDEITTEVAKGIIAKIKELSPESSRVVFKDNGFKTDSNKTNIKEILKSGGVEEFITI
jgi:adenine-specific DNA-methyltransferase